MRNTQLNILNGRHFETVNIKIIKICMQLVCYITNINAKFQFSSSENLKVKVINTYRQVDRKWIGIDPNLYDIFCLFQR